VFDVSWSLDAGELQLWAASRKVVEEVAAAIEAGFEVKLAPLSAGAQAVRAGHGEGALAPTAALLGVSREEARRGEA
jgi:recombination associated protein RdgC